MVQETALTSLASAAYSFQAILIKATNKSNQMLHAKSMECISLVGMTIGKEKFRANAKLDDSNQLMFIHCSMETITLRDNQIGIKTSVLVEKATMCNMLCCYADEQKEGFFPWIDQISRMLLDERQVKSVVDKIKGVICASPRGKHDLAT
ncbi:uncharacterized protein HKW66_Vig0238100 [Vigna angularis]|uniref:Uncharacterized protein n=1 Tax=Phaseolus angularis TaxID=3914 RepID=A0A8T0KWI5_PHAAN|nr:uncharacterized protein HKW66_Vig0238100 [Vigna angularis]